MYAWYFYFYASAENIPLGFHTVKITHMGFYDAMMQQ